MTQRADSLGFAAAGTPLNAAPTERAARPAQGRLQVAVSNANAAALQASLRTAAISCQQCLTLAFFFDGTGNNLEADVGTLQHSNVARLYEAHSKDDKTTGRYRFYIPGLGTYFREIGDPGGTSRGLGMGHMGQDRLDWAFKEFDKVVKEAEARAQNPTNKIISIKVGVFGFSRGATAARAFVRDLAARCHMKDGQHCLKAGGHPVEVIFLGIFDTVASVGLPMSANNTPGATTAGWYNTATTLKVRASSSGTTTLAFGEPGADPAPGSADGHADWADGLQVPAPDFVKRCVHMVAGHEIRNSFPLDSVLDGTRYLDGVSEMVFPGAHSDVGGGYQPGEGARSAHYGEMLSLVPLKAMHAAARDAGVPFDSISTLMGAAARIKKSFALDDEGAAKFAEMSQLWSTYMLAAGSGGRDIGKELLAHNAWYLRWRFFNARRNQNANGRGPDVSTVAQREPGFAAERGRLERTMNETKAKLNQASQELSRAEAALSSANYGKTRFGTPIASGVQERVEAARVKEKAAQDAYLRDKSKLDTFANDRALVGDLNAYDIQLIQDAQAIVSRLKSDPKLKLRPHYKNLVDAYNAHYVQKKPLDENIAAFFDRYVHDSLAGFAKDATLPSDPRVIYVGGDNKLRYATLPGEPGSRRSMAA
ncbi:DUF2235 domain-containing protein [Hydrogenophaga sp.]|uniref:T6SS phospholipase effector Tle1-like catalytic domain-containing protein n=1 Tax=Hydrogenophaga sp. TaxID=1904254 RepID=UPI00286E16FA|nr:DUF2235 domain-containing protein [Hydrogenophaga sp.]